MVFESGKLLLVGDNPFHGISHLSEDRARIRGNKISKAEYAGDLVLTALQNGANGFMFSVSETTLSILQVVSDNLDTQSVSLHAIVPYAYEYVRLATHLGTTGLGKKLAGRVAMSGNLRAIANGLQGAISMSPVALMKTYLSYEISRIKSSISKKQKLSCVLLHEVVTDMVIALNLDWFVKSYIHFISRQGIKPGFETRNFAYLVNKLREWDVDFNMVELVSSFNRAGFQMNPSKHACEEALASMSILAAGYLKLGDAIEYIENLPHLNGVVVGVSKERHAHETFAILRDKMAIQSGL